MTSIFKTKRHTKNIESQVQNNVFLVCFRCKNIRWRHALWICICGSSNVLVLVHMNFKLFKLKPKTHLSSDTIEYEKWMTAYSAVDIVFFFFFWLLQANPWKCLTNDPNCCFAWIAYGSLFLHYYQDQLQSDTFKIWIWLQRLTRSLSLARLWARARKQTQYKINRKRYKIWHGKYPNAQHALSERDKAR